MMMQRLNRYSPVLVAGFAGVIALVLVSLPLRSPHDSLMNAGTAAAGGIVTTSLLAVPWDVLRSRSDRPRLFAGVCAVALVRSIAAAFLAQVFAELERTVSFVSPLAAILFVTMAVVAPLVKPSWGWSAWLAGVLLVVAAVLGVVFAGDGDQRSGTLSLPPRATATLSQTMIWEGQLPV